MDPITLLGTAESVVGIAGLSIQLSQVLYHFMLEVRAANITLRFLVDGVNATTGAMGLVRGLLKDEKKNIERGHPAIPHRPDAEYQDAFNRASERYRQDIDDYIRRRDEAERYMGSARPCSCSSNCVFTYSGISGICRYKPM